MVHGAAICSLSGSIETYAINNRYQMYECKMQLKHNVQMSHHSFSNQNVLYSVQLGVGVLYYLCLIETINRGDKTEPDYRLNTFTQNLPRIDTKYFKLCNRVAKVNVFNLATFQSPPPKIYMCESEMTVLGDDLQCCRF